MGISEIFRILVALQTYMHFCWICMQVPVYNKQETDKEPYNPIDLWKIEQRILVALCIQMITARSDRSILLICVECAMHRRCELSFWFRFRLSIISIGHYITLRNNEIAFWYQNNSHESWLKVKRHVGYMANKHSPVGVMMHCKLWTIWKIPQCW